MPGSDDINIKGKTGETVGSVEMHYPKYGKKKEEWHARPTKWKGNYEEPLQKAPVSIAGIRNM